MFLVYNLYNFVLVARIGCGIGMIAFMTDLTTYILLSSKLAISRE